MNELITVPQSEAEIADNRRLVELRADYDAYIGPRPMQEMMIDSGITPALLTSKLLEELDANETKLQLAPERQIITDPNTGDQIEIISQQWKESMPRIVWAIRQRARLDATKYLQSYPGDGNNITNINNRTLVVEIRDVSKEVRDKLDAAAQSASQITSDPDPDVIDIGGPETEG